MMEATGFRSDVETLLTKFVETESVRFEDFARIFREMNFSLVFFLLEDEEVPLFLDTAYAITRDFLQPKFDFQVRVGALYLLFALFTQQPSTGKDRVKIKFTPQLWTEFIELIVEVKEQDHHDTNYIFYQLYTGKAFYIVAHSDVIVMNREQNKISSSTNSQLREVVSLDNYLDPAVFRNIEEVHRKYEQSKSSLVSSIVSSNETLSSTTAEPERSMPHVNNLSMCNKNLLSDITSQLTQFREMLEKMQNESTDFIDTAAPPTTATSTSSATGTNYENVGMSRGREVKLRAMNSSVSVPRHFTSSVKEEAPSSLSSSQQQQPHLMTSSPSTAMFDSESVSHLDNAQCNSTTTQQTSTDGPNEDTKVGIRKHAPVFSVANKPLKKTIRSILSNPRFSNQDLFQGAVSLQNANELPYLQQTQNKQTSKEQSKNIPK